MTKIYIVELRETIYDYGEGDDSKNIEIVKAFKSRNAAKNFMNDCHNAYIKMLKEANANIEYQEIDDELSCIYWNNHGNRISGVTDYIILERELAD